MATVPVGSNSETVLKVTRFVQALVPEGKSDNIIICSSSVTCYFWQVLQMFFCFSFMCPFAVAIDFGRYSRINWGVSPGKVAK